LLIVHFLDDIFLTGDVVELQAKIEVLGEKPDTAPV
jgi:hypothetical protein